ncbi:hypothetical protein COEREDRAFT_78811 [Coemansia reversa NRRL 1564]|uniref:Proteasome assembly chaperone 3 n=1 Tax=Coemansia reversa (strain ATCC 12441 / NRRL 1564) TaxID=763665 RepID=A0A2G5BKB9_COERN|nr:hypothetical protein COEREDRAFT_78811 [Coemansia reversa NRRL 1564]|eukprot:PIA19456.1 hypothetical protein COEREDRAFT_78811 [Coemansia reversa NRRL 1564]
MIAAIDPPAFPVSVNIAAAVVNGKHTDIAVLGFSNCAVVLLTQLQSIGSLIQAIASRMTGSTEPVEAEQVASRLAGISDLPVDLKFLLGNPPTATTASSLYQILAIELAQRKRQLSPNDARPIIIGVALDIPRVYKLSSTSDDDSVPDPSAFSALIGSLATLVDKHKVW